MTILVNNLVKQTYVTRIQSHKLSPNGVGAAITIYSGTKPSAADYIANYNTTYGSAANAFLWHGTGNTVWTTYNANNVTTVYTSTPPTASVPLHNGTATWAVVWCTAIPIGSMATLPASATATTLYAGFFICDVSSVATGTGVVQLLSTTLSTADSALTIESAGFSVQ